MTVRTGHRLGPKLALVALLAAGCRGEAERGRVVEFWALGREGEVVQRMMPEFERRNPGVHVRVQQIPWSAAHEKLLTAFVGGSMPDVFQVGNTWIPEFVALDAVEPLGERAKASSALALDDYFSGIVDTNVVEGSLAGIPWYVDTRLLFYRADILEAAGAPTPPRSWSAWVEAMTRVQKRAVPGDVAILLPLTEWAPLVILALESGAELLRDGDTYGNFQSARFRSAFRFYVDLYRQGLATLASQTQVASLYQDFARGAFVFYLSGPWNVGELRDRMPPRVRWSTAPMPAPDGSYPGVSLAGGASLTISRHSSEKDAAWKLIEFLSEPAQEIELYRVTGDLPARRSAWTAEGPGGDPRTSAFRTQLEHVVSSPKIPEWERIANLIVLHSEATIRGQVGEDEALARLDRDVDRLLEKRRWMIERRRQAS